MSYAPRSSGAPRDDPETSEPTGPVAKDSLAAESMREGGGFAENENAEALGVRGEQSTLNNTDISGATTLRSAPDAQTRERQDERGLGSDEKGPGGTKYPDAEAPSESSGGLVRDAYSGASGDSFASDGGAEIIDTSGITSSSGTSGGSSAAARLLADDDLPSTRAAPSYVGVVTGDIQSEGQNKPKSKDLHEGGIPETKTFTGNVGGVHDPGRLAEKDFQGINKEENVGTTGGLQYQSKPGDTDGGQYEVLQSERA